MKSAILITAGPTRERIDPVRFISNYSTGTFGYELAKESLSRGCRTTLVSGPTALKPPEGVKFIGVESALEMARAVKKELGRHDCLIMAAAVSDWRPLSPSKNKIKRELFPGTLELVENPDILKASGAAKRGKILVGFALETEDLERNALRKMRQKNLDMIVSNKLDRKARIFGDNETDALIIDKFGGKTMVKGKSKKQLAGMIIDKVLKFVM